MSAVPVVGYMVVRPNQRPTFFDDEVTAQWAAGRVPDAVIEPVIKLSDHMAYQRESIMHVDAAYRRGRRFAR
jgi:hypothetical protein